MMITKKNAKVVPLYPSKKAFNKQLISLHKDLEELHQGLDEILTEPAPVDVTPSFKLKMSVFLSNLKSVFCL